MLQGLWERVLGEKLTPEVRARVVGVQAQMEKFQFYFGVALGELNAISAACRVASYSISTVVCMHA